MLSAKLIAKNINSNDTIQCLYNDKCGTILKSLDSQLILAENEKYSEAKIEHIQNLKVFVVNSFTSYENTCRKYGNCDKFNLKIDVAVVEKDPIPPVIAPTHKTK